MSNNRSVDIHRFSMVPRSDVPRSTFKIEKTYKTTFDSGYLIPIFLEEVLPGDSFSTRLTAFARLATPLFPVMDNLYMDFFFFFTPNRLLWANWVKFMGEQDNPADSIVFTMPQQVSPVSGYAVGSLQDYFGLPTVGQMTAATFTHCALPLRAYNRIYKDWFRDENLQNSPTIDVGDGPDTVGNYVLLRRGKRHDYFTSCLPWPQKGNAAVSLPLGTTAPVVSNAGNFTMRGGTNAMTAFTIDAAANGAITHVSGSLGTANFGPDGTATTGLRVDLSTATAATINQIRTAFQTQKFLERDARGGTRYTELIRSHFGVTSPDFRLMRPEYLGGGSVPIIINPISQQSGTGASGTTTPVGTLAGIGTAVSSGIGFSQSFSEHGYILGLVAVRADLTYQQGVRRLWSRLTRFDHYFPVFAALGEQSVLNKEIYADGSANDANVFGYQERWSEYRYSPSQITGLFRSTSAGTVDPWHLAQKFTVLPTLNTTFIQDTPPVSRVVAVGAGANGQQLLFDGFFSSRVTRCMPMYSVPGSIDRL